jgi:putative addiction module component (TIGR02574 family)
MPVGLGLAALAGYARWRQVRPRRSFGNTLALECHMDLKAVLTEVRCWPPEDRLRLIEEVWDGLAEEDYQPELTEELKDLLDGRLAALDADPGNVLTWDEIKAYVRRPR